jgi:hypothetical protein
MNRNIIDVNHGHANAKGTRVVTDAKGGRYA